MFFLLFPPSIQHGALRLYLLFYVPLVTAFACCLVFIVCIHDIYSPSSCRMGIAMMKVLLHASLLTFAYISVSHKPRSGVVIFVWHTSTLISLSMAWSFRSMFALVYTHTSNTCEWTSPSPLPTFYRTYLSKLWHFDLSIKSSIRWICIFLITDESCSDYNCSVSFCNFPVYILYSFLCQSQVSSLSGWFAVLCISVGFRHCK